jgi:serine/threonine protein phosphatase PrpC/predicted Ser/Thr protein kinase
MSQQLRISIGSYSHRGQKPINQDSFAVRGDNLNAVGHKGMVAVVADGVSHCEDGQLASQACVAGFMQDYFNTPKTWRVEQSVSQVLTGLNRWLYRHGQTDQRIEQQRLTTFTAAIVQDTWLHIFHVGDSRAYLYRDGKLQQLTTDHCTWVGSNQILNRAIGAGPSVQIDFSSHQLQQGDGILLTTDGVHQSVTPAQLAYYNAELPEVDLDARARQLVEWSAEQGSEDNMTAVLLRLDELPQVSISDQLQDPAQLPIPPVLKSGQSLDGFKVLDVISATPRSMVYQVECLHSGRQLVLKAPSAALHDDPVAMSSFVREAWVANNVKHSQLMHGHANPNTASANYMLLEYVPGASLRQWIYDHPQASLDRVRDIIKQLVGVVRALHRLGVQHRDLRPENIIIQAHGKLMIIDYGSVAVAGLSTPLEECVGALEYAAPELILGGPCQQPDQYAIAVIAYELLTGHTPFAQTPRHWQRYRRLSEFRYQPIYDHRKDLPYWLNACLDKALSPDPRHRYPAMSEFWQDFTTPSDRLIRPGGVPLLERHPVAVWQSLCLMLALALLVQNIYWWL